ncbi:MAG: CAP domain-containing protein [Planctomycetota bacterium]
MRPLITRLVPMVLGALLLAGCGAGGSSGIQLPSEDPGINGEMTQEEMAYALEVFDRTNAERAGANLDQLTWHAEAAAVAQAHNRDMRTRGFFAHKNPDGLEPDDRLTRAGISWSAWGENIARAQATPAEVMRSWMNSTGHRENILSDWFSHLGVGCLLLSNGPYWTQAFLSP